VSENLSLEPQQYVHMDTYFHLLSRSHFRFASPLFDPLGIGGQDPIELKAFYKGLCEDNDLKSSKLLELAQERQDNHVGQWVKEMIRIAKPGKPVIVELVSPHVCEPNDLMGLVPRSFWRPAVDKYEWDVDPESIVIETNELMVRRYNVFMRKNGKVQPD
jgi:hypothetical protein